MILSKLVSKNLSKSRGNRKEMVGYQIIQTLLDKFITVIISTMEMSNYDTLILKMLPEKHHLEKENLYGRLSFSFRCWPMETLYCFTKRLLLLKINTCTVVICLQNQINQLVLLNNLIIIYFLWKNFTFCLYIPSRFFSVKQTNNSKLFEWSWSQI
jgi:hypothetical protein